MALIKEIGAGPYWPKKHSRSYLLSMMHGRHMLRRYPRVRKPRARTPPLAQQLRYHDWEIHVRRLYQAQMAHDWNKGNIPHNQPWWAAKAAAIPVTRYNGEVVTLNAFEWFIWYQNRANQAWWLNAYPYTPAWMYPYLEPADPWDPPIAGDLRYIKALDPADFQVAFWKDETKSQIYNGLLWLQKNPRTTPLRPSHFYECPFTDQWDGGTWFQDFADLTPFFNRIPDGTRCVVGWGLWEMRWYDDLTHTWIEKQQPSEIRWQAFPWGINTFPP
jgi:hypothetical protein